MLELAISLEPHPCAAADMLGGPHARFFGIEALSTGVVSSDATMPFRTGDRTGQRGTRFSTRNVSPPYTGTHVFTIRTSQLGRGPVSLTLATTNRNALISIPAPTCTTVITVR